VIDADALRDDARAVAARRLLKARGLLLTLDPEEQRVIEEIAYAVALGVAECLLEEAAESTLVEAALAR
jgi:hypothetical protein